MAKKRLKKRTAVARRKRPADTQTRLNRLGPPDPVFQLASVFVVMGHRAGSHGVIGLYASRARAEQEKVALETKGNKHARSYEFTIDERQIQQ